MVESLRLLCPMIVTLVTATTVLTGCVDEPSGSPTAVPLQPTVVRPPLATTPPSPPAPPVAASPSPSPAVSGRTYIVREGDSLSTIASNVYGDASQWRPIFDANRDQLPTESQLQIGQTLRIPPLPTPTATVAVRSTP